MWGYSDKDFDFRLEIFKIRIQPIVLLSSDTRVTLVLCGFFLCSIQSCLEVRVIALQHQDLPESVLQSMSIRPL